MSSRPASSSTEDVWTIIVGAGRARRFGADKLEVALGDGSVLDMAVETARRVSEGTVLVVGADSPRLAASPGPEIRVVAGGATRSESVRCGLAVIPDDARVILVHDAARPLADEALYGRVIAAVREGADGAVPVVPVVDTIRSLDGTPVDRETLRAVQTPQGFAADVIRRAHARNGEASDDATLVEAAGGTVVLVEGDVRNLKITRPADVDVARTLLGDQAT